MNLGGISKQTGLRKRHLFFLLLSISLTLFAGLIWAYQVNHSKKTLAAGATCYWVGDTSPANWNDITHWSSSSGGGGSTCGGPGGLPGSSDTVVFNNANSNDVNVDMAVSVAAITNTNYGGTFATNNNTVAVSGDVTFGSGVLDLGANTWTLSGGFDLRGATLVASTSSVIMNGSVKLIYGNKQTFNNIQFSGNTHIGANENIDTKDFYVNGILTVDNGITLEFEYRANVYMNNGSTTTLNGTIAEGSSGTAIHFIDSAGANLSTGGTLLVKSTFETATSNITIPARNYGNFEVINNTANNYVATLGTASGQTISTGYTVSNGNIYVTANGSGNLTLDAATYNPNVNDYCSGDTTKGKLDFGGSGSGTEIINAGDGTWLVDGDIDFTGGTFNPGHSTVYSRVDAGQNPTITSAGNSFYNFLINNPGSIGRNFTFADNFTVTNNLSMTAVNNAFTVKFTAGTTNTAANISINGASGHLITLKSVTDSSQWFFNVAQASPAVSYLSVRDSNASGGNRITATNTTDGTGNVNWRFMSVVDISGTVYNNKAASGNIGAGKTIGLTVNGAAKVTTETTAGGAYAFSGINVGNQDPIALFIDNEDEEGCIFTQAPNPSANISGLNFYVNETYLTHESTGPATNALLAVVDSSIDSDIKYTASGGSITFDPNFELWIKSGKTYTPGGAILTGNFDLDGTLTLAANGATIAGSFDATGGAFTTTGTISFTAASTGKTITSNNQHFYNLVFNNTAGGWQFLDPLNIDGSLTITNSESAGYGVNFNNQTVAIAGNFQIDGGKLTTGSSAISIVGNWTKNGGTVDAGTSTVTFGNVSGGSTISGDMTGVSAFNNLTLNSATYNPYKRVVALSNGSGATQTNYPIRIALSGANFNFAGSTSDGRDLRFFDSDNTTALNYFIESWNQAGQTAIVWVKVPSITVAGKNIYLYYGNSNLTAQSSAANTFTAYDSFSGGSLSADWTVLSGNGAITEGGGTVNFNYTGSENNDWNASRNEKVLKFNTAPAGDFSAEVDLNNYTVTDGTCAGVVAYQDDTHAYSACLVLNGADYRYYSDKIGVGNNGQLDIHTLPSRFAVRRVGSTMSFWLSVDNGATWAQIGNSFSDITLNNVVLFGKEWSTNNLIFTMDNFVIRKFATTEPTASVGAESDSGINLILASNIGLKGNLLITSGNFVTQGYDLTIGGNSTISTNGIITATHDNTKGGATVINLAGNWSNSGIFTVDNSTLNLNGTSAQTVTINGENFYNLGTSNASSGGIVFSGATNVTNLFTDITPGSKITFHAGSTYAFQSLNINGSPGHNILMLSSNPGNDWIFNVAEAAPTVTYVTPTDSNANGGSEIDDRVGGFNGSNNHHWLFGVSAVTISLSNVELYQGAVKTLLATAYNGDGAVIPGADVTWSVIAGGGSILPDGTFTAGNTIGTFADTVKAVYGQVPGFASVKVNELPPTPSADTSGANETNSIAPGNNYQKYHSSEPTAAQEPIGANENKKDNSGTKEKSFWQYIFEKIVEFVKAATRAVAESKPTQAASIALATAAAVATSASAAVGTVGAQMALKDYWLALVGYIGSVASRKKRDKYGLVYDGETGKPVEKTLVQLFDHKTMRLIASTITDKEGHYIFAAKKGEYVMSAIKPGYIFPSQNKLEIDGLGIKYKGQTIKIEGAQEAINAQIPIDTVADAKSFAKRLPVLNLSFLRPAILIFGSYAAVAGLVLNHSTLNYCIVAAFFLLWINELFVQHRKLKFSKVLSGADKKPIDLALVRVVSPEGKLIQTYVTDYDGTVLPEIKENGQKIVIEKAGIGRGEYEHNRKGIVEGKRFKL